VGTIYGLMVGINNYLSPNVRNLAGCRADIEEATAFLRQRATPGTRVDIKTLVDSEATGQAIVDAFRGHLTKAAKGDTAVFWYSGHGSTAPLPPQFWHLEPNGRQLQTLVCADSRLEGRPDLLDKELALLLDDVAEGGCHVVVVLDSCHSGGATRGPDVVVRTVPRASVPPAYHLLPDLAERYAAGAPAVRHVLLAACQPEELAGETRLDGTWRGQFTWALLRAMHRAGPTTTYRELVTLARNEIERVSTTQRPLVLPAGAGLADQQLLSDSIAAAPNIAMRFGRDGWELNAGSCHAIEPGTAGDETRFAVAGQEPVHEVRVTAVEVRRTLVTPIGWAPDPQRVYPVVLSHVATPATAVGISPAVDPEVAERIRTTLGRGNPQVRIVEVADAELIIDAPLGMSGRPGVVQLTDRNGAPIWQLDVVYDAHRALADLAHIGRWRQIKSTTNPVSQLIEAVSIDIVEPLPGETIAPRDRVAALPDPDGTFRLSYELQNGRWMPPRRFIRLRNTTRRPLYCALLDLTERFKIDATLFRGARIGECAVVAVGEGAPIDFYLPNDVPIEPGTSYRDWLMLIVSTEEIDGRPYEMPALGPVTRDTAVGHKRDVEVAAFANDWWTTVVPIITEVPERSPARSPGYTEGTQ